MTVALQDAEMTYMYIFQVSPECSACTIINYEFSRDYSSAKCHILYTWYMVIKRYRSTVWHCSTY